MHINEDLYKNKGFTNHNMNQSFNIFSSKRALILEVLEPGF